MPITPIHISFNLGVYYIISLFTPVNFLIINCVLLISAELIDLDHLFAKPIYDPKRNSFKSHFFHKNWKYVLIISILTRGIYPITFISLGLISHLLLDYIYTIYHKL